MRRHGNQPTEGGAILVFTALVLLVLMGVAAIAVDLGNAWSTRRQAQTAADVGAVGALQEIPHSFATSIPPIAADEVQALIDTLNTVNSPGAIGNVVISADFLEISLDIDATARNSFSRAIGAGATTNAGADSTARIEIPPVDILFPVGFEAPQTQPHQCLEISLPAYSPPAAGADPSPRVCISGNGARNAVLEMAELTDPTCAIATEPDAVDHFRNGVDHLVDEYDVAEVRSEVDACTYGHRLTMPNRAEYITMASYPQLLTNGVADPGGPLAGSSAAIWDYMDPAPATLGSCNSSNFADPLILEEKTQNMRSCLQAWYATAGAPRLFTELVGGSSLIDSARFGWAIDIDNDSFTPADFEAPLLMWFHTLIYDDPDFTMHPDYSQYLNTPATPPPVEVGAVTVYALDPSMLSVSDENALRTPWGTDELEFYVTE